MSGLRVPHTTSSARVVRVRLLASLSSAGVPSEVTEDVLLVAAELVTNALRHAAATEGELVVGWRVGPEGVTVRVADGSAGTPRARHAGSRDTGGRGMTIVDALCDEWGVDPLANGATGKEVWARVGLAAEPATAGLAAASA